MIAPRGRVGAGELYAFPAGAPPPDGRPICTVSVDAAAPPLAFVYEAR